MKKFTFIMGVLLASLATTGCTKKDEPATSTSPATTPATTKETTTTTTQTTVTSPASTPAVAVSATASSASATATATATTATNNKGESLYQNSCRVCHDTGNLGSPRMGDKAAWKDRIAQGNDVLYSHAINGFTGKTGTMPPKGTSTAPDSEIKQAVDYMVSKSK